MSDTTTAEPELVLSHHAVERIDERVAPLFNCDSERAQTWILRIARIAHRYNGFTRKPPKWALSREIPKGAHHRYVRAKVSGHDFLVVLSRVSDERTVIITVIRNDQDGYPKLDPCDS